MAYVKYNTDGSFKSSIDKFYNTETLKKWASKCNSNPGDLILILSGDKLKVQKQMNELRLLMGERLGLRNPNDFKPVWVIDFPLLEKDEQTNEYHAMHHPFTSPKDEDQDLLNSNPSKVRANAYDLAINGVEVGGGSIRIHDRQIQEKMFQILGFTKDEAELQFGFLMKAFEYGAPPHGGIAFGFDRLCTLFGGKENIREFIAFPKNNHVLLNQKLKNYAIDIDIPQNYTLDYNLLVDEYVETSYNKAVKLLDKEDFSKSESLFKEISKLKPNYKDVNNMKDIATFEPIYRNGNKLLELEKFRAGYRRRLQGTFSKCFIFSFNPNLEVVIYCKNK